MLEWLHERVMRWERATPVAPYFLIANPMSAIGVARSQPMTLRDRRVSAR
jgi:hypothetical protein